MTTCPQCGSVVFSIRTIHGQQIVLDPSVPTYELKGPINGQYAVPAASYVVHGCVVAVPVLASTGPFVDPRQVSIYDVLEDGE